MLTEQGHAKVMDFGLAKRLATDEGTEQDLTSGLTMEGSTLGTPAYMSPEQVRAEPVDHRSDIFSFGIILYEMLTGIHPFRRRRPVETMGAILHEEPEPLSDRLPSSTELLQETVRLMLAKNPDDRIQSIDEVAVNLSHPVTLRKIRSRLPTAKKAMCDPTDVTITEAWRSRKWLKPSILLGVFAGLAGVLFYLIRSPDEGVPHLVNPVQLTSAVGIEDYATWSPDGGRLAYESNQSGNWDIWVAQAGHGDSVNLTANREGPERYPSWSPDGLEIAFLSQEDKTWGLYTMAAVGGTPRKLVSLPINPVYYRGRPEWSSDGSEIAVAFSDASNNYAEIVTVLTQETRRIPLPRREGNPAIDLAWSPDGRMFAYVEADGDAAEVTRIYTVPSTGGEPNPITSGRTNDRNPSWSADGRSLYFISNRGGSMDLWNHPLSEDGGTEGSAERVTSGLGIRSAVFSPDRTKVAYSQGRPVANLWRILIPGDRVANWADAEQLTFDNALIQFFDISPDDKLIALSSDRSGNQDLWVLPCGGGPMSRLTTDPAPDWCPRWSPDGSEIAFYAYRTGNRDIWVIPSEGGPAKQITTAPAEEVLPIWSPDGTKIAFTSRRSGNRDVWIRDLEGGEVRQITFDSTDESAYDWSPDGIWLIFASGSGPYLHRVPAAGGEPEVLGKSQVVTSGARFSSDGKELYFVGQHDLSHNLWALSLEEGSRYSLANVAGRTGTLGWGVDTDGEYIYFTWAEETGDLWVMDVEAAHN
jgi:Tol biopolymer transport system component